MLQFGLSQKPSQAGFTRQREWHQNRRDYRSQGEGQFEEEVLKKILKSSENPKETFNFTCIMCRIERWTVDRKSAVD